MESSEKLQYALLITEISKKDYTDRDFRPSSEISYENLVWRVLWNL